MTSKKTAAKSRPFVFRLTRETLEECRGMSAAEKLKWLEEANRFVQKFVTKDQRARWKKLTHTEN
jgi:hypothetical protein